MPTLATHPAPLLLPSSPMPRRHLLAGARRRVLVGAVALAGALVGPLASAPAQAALIDTSACNEAALSQPFLRWGDTNSYELVPGGHFEGPLAGWTLTGGAALVAGGEPYGVTGSVGQYSLGLPAGASAQSPFTCVDAAYPTFRFFALSEDVDSTLVVQVVSRTALGTVSLPLGVLAPSGEWEPTLPMLTGSVLTGALSGGTTEVALSFTALTGGSRIDDVYVDPRMK